MDPPARVGQHHSMIENIQDQAVETAPPPMGPNRLTQVLDRNMAVGTLMSPGSVYGDRCVTSLLVPRGSDDQTQARPVRYSSTPLPNRVPAVVGQKQLTAGVNGTAGANGTAGVK